MIVLLAAIAVFFVNGSTALDDLDLNQVETNKVGEYGVVDLKQVIANKVGESGEDCVELCRAKICFGEKCSTEVCEARCTKIRNKIGKMKKEKKGKDSGKKEHVKGRKDVVGKIKDHFKGKNKEGERKGKKGTQVTRRKERGHTEREMKPRRSNERNLKRSD